MSTDSDTSEIVVRVPACAIRAALRFTSSYITTREILRCIRFHSDGDALLVDATDAYHLIRLRVDRSSDSDRPEVDALVDFGSRPRFGRESHDVHMHIAGDHGYLSGQTSKYGYGTRTYFGVREGKFPDFGDLLPSGDAAYDGAVDISFDAELITDIYKAALDIGTAYVKTLGLVHSERETVTCPVAFEAEGSGVSMRALLMPAKRGALRRAYVRGDHD